MLIGGIQKLSLVDYPGKTSITIFTIGCNMRCGFCHNKELVVPECFTDDLDTENILKFIESRKGLIESVTVSGGEPCLHKDLPDFIRKIKDMGFLVKLDSNGTRPEMIEQLLAENLLDFIAMDIKAPIKNYEKVTNRPIVDKDIIKSINLIKNSSIDYEFRTTVIKSLHDIKDFEQIGKLIGEKKKARRYALQHFRPAKTLDPKYAKDTTLSEDDFNYLQNLMQKYAEKVIIH